MATIRELRTKFTADAKGIKNVFREISGAARDFGREVTNSTDVANRGFRDLEGSTRELNRVLETVSGRGFEPLSRAAQDAQREIEETGSVTTETMARLENAVDGSARHFDSLSSEARASLGDVESAVANVVGDLGQLGSAAGGSLRGLSSATAGASSDLNNLAGDVNNLDNELQDLGSDTGLDELNSDVEGLGGSLGSLGGSGGIIAGVTGMLGAAAIGLGGFVAAGAGLFALIKGGDDLQGTLNGIQAATGSSNEEMTGMKDTLKNIYGANYGESFEDIAASMTLVNQMTGASNEELESLTTNALMLRDTFEYDVAESTKAANILMKQFGIDGTEAFALIAEGTQEGLNYADDLLDTIGEYSPYYEAAGFSAQEMFGMFKNAQETGAFNLDYAADAFKEFGIIMTEDSTRASDALSAIGLDGEKLRKEFAAGGETAKGAFQTIATKLGEIKDPQAQMIAGVELFGTKFEDLGPQAVIAMSQANDSIKGTKSVLEDIDKVKYNTIGEAIKGMGRAFVVDVLIPVQDRLMPVINEGFEKFKAFSETAKIAFGALKEFLTGNETASDVLESYGLDPANFDKIVQYGNLLQENLSKIRQRAGEVFENLKSGFNTLKGNALPVLETIASTFMRVFNTLKPIVVPILNDVANFVGSIFKKIMDFWNSDGAQLLTAIQNAFNGIMKVVDFVMPAVLAIIKSVWGNVKGVITGALDVIMGAAKVFSGLFTGDFSKMWEGLKQMFKGAINFLWNFVQLTFYGKILGGAAKFFSAFKGGFATLWAGIKGLFSGGVSAAWQLIKKGWDDMLKATKSVFSNIGNFIRDTWSSIKSITSGAINIVKTVFTKGWGFVRDTTTRTFSGIWNFIKTVVGNIKTRISDTWTAIKNSTSNSFSAIFNGIKNRFNDIVNAAKALPGRIGTGIGNMASKVTAGVTKVINTLARTLGKGVNGVIGGINWVLGKIGVDSKVPKWEVPQYAQGTNKGKHPGGPMIVGDGKGANRGPELIRNPDGSQMLSPSKPTLMYGEEGTEVFSAKMTKEILAMVPHYAWGTDALKAAGSWVKEKYNSGKQAVKNVGSKIKDTALNVLDYVKNPGKLLDVGLKALGIEKPDSAGFTGKMAVGAWNKVKKGAIDYVKGKLGTFASSQSGISLTGGNGGGFGPPFRFTSGPGPRNTGIPGASTFHKGWDWAAPIGTKIPSVTDGVVTRNSWHPLSGNFVEVRSGNKTHRYQHNSKNLVSVGQQVKKGQTLALVGDTGVGSGAHLHYEVKGYEDGGIATGKFGPQLAWLTEGGFAESIISHDPSKKASQRAIWEETGEKLGFKGEDNKAMVDLLQRIAEGVEAGKDIRLIMNERTVGKLVEGTVSEEQKIRDYRTNLFKQGGRTK